MEHLAGDKDNGSWSLVSVPTPTPNRLEGSVGRCGCLAVTLQRTGTATEGPTFPVNWHTDRPRPRQSGKSQATDLGRRGHLEWIGPPLIVSPVTAVQVIDTLSIHGTGLLNDALPVRTIQSRLEPPHPKTGMPPMSV